LLAESIYDPRSRDTHRGALRKHPGGGRSSSCSLVMGDRK
jgi:hypothetical protein